MIDSTKWMNTLRQSLCEAFGKRLLFLGLQGSYRRGEATERSDIDVVTILDRLDSTDLQTYRSSISALPEAEKACGFISGQAELFHWPKHELFQLLQDTDGVYGDLASLLPPVSTEELREGLRSSAAALYHAACHTCLYGDGSGLSALLKGAYFTLQLQHYLSTGVYARSKRALLPLLEGDEYQILLRGMVPAPFPLDSADLFLRWCSKLLCQKG